MIATVTQDAVGYHIAAAVIVTALCGTVCWIAYLIYKNETKD